MLFIHCVEFIHYGSPKFKPDVKYRRDDKDYEWSSRTNKPVGCLWSSPVDAKHSWKNFVRDSRFLKKHKNLRKYFRFVIDESAKVLVINRRSIRKIFKKYGYERVAYVDDGVDMRKKMFDWLSIERDYDAVYVDVTSLGLGELHSLIDEYNLAGWDVDSLCVWNLKKVKVL